MGNHFFIQFILTFFVTVLKLLILCKRLHEDFERLRLIESMSLLYNRNKNKTTRIINHF
jgi:hypothetical protein